jgi:hypothetical protein
LLASEPNKKILKNPFIKDYIFLTVRAKTVFGSLLTQLNKQMASLRGQEIPLF